MVKLRNGLRMVAQLKITIKWKEKKVKLTQTKQIKVKTSEWAHVITIIAPPPPEKKSQQWSD